MRFNFVLSIILVSLYASAQEFDKFEARIVIKDSITLATDVYKPKGSGPWPVILIRTPYSKEQLQSEGAFFSANGYVVVTQDVRGKYKSGGVFIPFVNEIEDGKLTLDWIVRQPWSDKAIGIYGSSYAGFCGLSLTDGKHPALKTVFNNAGWLTNQNVIEEGGAINLLLGIPWTYSFTGTNTMRRPNIRFDSLFKILPAKNILSNMGFDNWWLNLDTLLQVNKNFRYQNVKIPIMHITGWFDFTMKGTMDFYEKVNKFKTSHQKLVIGPWLHGQNYFKDSTKVGDEDFGTGAKFGVKKLHETALKWFDEHLKNPQPLNPSVDLFVLFFNRWITAPPDITRNTKLYRLFFNSDKGANSRIGDGKLVAQKPQKQSVDTFTYDPLKPVPTNGGANFHFFPNYLGVKDQIKLQNRKDILVYISEPMDSNTTVLGNPSVDLYVTSSAETTDFTVKIFIADDSSGTRKLVADAIQRVTPDQKNFKQAKIQHVKINTGYIAFQIKKGQRLGLEISSSNFPKFDRNLNTTEASFNPAYIKEAKQKVYHSPAYPSSISFPVYMKSL